MKKLAALLMFLSFGVFGVQAQQPAFQAGEKITYTVFYNVVGMYVNAGTATLSISSAKMLNNDVLHVVGEGSTNSRYDWIFKVRDRYESFLDAETLQPYKFVRHIQLQLLLPPQRRKSLMFQFFVPALLLLDSYLSIEYPH